MANWNIPLSRSEAPWVPEIYNNAMLANGKLFPYLEVEPRKYRFRVMNGSNSRFFRLSIGNLLGMHQIGSDPGIAVRSGRHEAAVYWCRQNGRDLVFDFSAYAGQELLLKSDASSCCSSAWPRPQRGIPVRCQPPCGRRRGPRDARDKDARLTLDESMDMVQQSMAMLLNNTPWHMPVTENPVLDSTEIWSFSIPPTIRTPSICTW